MAAGHTHVRGCRRQYRLRDRLRDVGRVGVVHDLLQSDATENSHILSPTIGLLQSDATENSHILSPTNGGAPRELQMRRPHGIGDCRPDARAERLQHTAQVADRGSDLLREDGYRSRGLHCLPDVLLSRSQGCNQRPAASGASQRGEAVAALESSPKHVNTRRQVGDAKMARCTSGYNGRDQPLRASHASERPNISHHTHVHNSLADPRPK